MPVLFAAACLFGTGAAGKDVPRWEKFADGRMQVFLPDHYEVSRVEGGVLHAWSGADKVGFKLELKHAGDRMSDGKSGEKLVRENAKFLKAEEHRSGNKVVLLESATKDTSKGKVVRRIDVQIGFGRSLVLMTITVFDDQKDAREVKRFFDTDMDRIVSSMRAVPQRDPRSKSGSKS